MRSLLGAVKATVGIESPVPFVSGDQIKPVTGKGGMAAQMATYDQVGVVFSIVSKLATGVASVDWHLWREAQSGIKEERVMVTNHAALDMLNQPNPWHSRQEYLEGTQQHIDLAGEGWWVITRSSIYNSPIPLGMYYVRPDRMAPIPHPTRFIDGYVYFGPKGEMIPLGVDEVIQVKMTNPNDPYRGVGPMGPAMIDSESARLSAIWNRNFFVNDASPGGLIKLDRKLTDDQFKAFGERWRGQHQGVANAHRVAVLEQGDWIERAFNMRDMQFVELRNLSDEQIRKAFGFPKTMLGSVDDVNRANAEAGKAMFAEHCVMPRLERLKGALNRLLRMFGPTADGLVFDYDNPIPPNAEQQNADRASKSTAAQILVTAGWEPTAVLEVVGLPDMPFVGPPPAPAPPGGGFQMAAPVQIEAHSHSGHAHAALPPVRAEGDPQHDQQLQTIQKDWEQTLNAVMGEWRGITAQTRTDILDRVRAAVESGDTEALANIPLNEGLVGEGAVKLRMAMMTLAALAAQRVVDEAAHQGVNIGPISISEDQVHEFAKAVATSLAKRLLLAAGREALRRMTPSSTSAEVVQGVRQHLESFSDRDELDQLGGALTNAQNSARIATLRSAPEAAYYADETLDKNTCAYCRQVDGRWLGNDLDKVERLYPNGGYIDCEGGPRCRGTVVAVFRPATTDTPSFHP